MCIAVFIWKAHPLYSFILLLNRDEYHNRPTDPLTWWDSDDAQPILGGRDALAGGTWLACSKDGRLAFLTNVREVRLPSESQQHQPKSRGYLPVRFLKSKKSPEDFAEELMLEAEDYDGFNLIVADLCSLSMEYITNRPKGTGITATQVSPGVHVLSNATLDTPWPKSQRLERSFKAVSEKCGEEIPLKELPEKLMRDTTKDDDESKLPHIYPLEWEHQLSSIFVDSDTPMGRYGTRSTSMVTVQKSGYVTFYETHLDKEVWKDRNISFQVEKARTTNS